MKPKPRCSVVIPTYNCLDFLPLAIASARTQAIDDLEILVVDDGSTDGTAKWLEQEARYDSRIIVLRSERKGPSFARNLAISRATAPFIAFLDADDLWWRHKLSRQLAFHERHRNFTFSFTDYLHLDPRGAARGSCFDYWRPSYVDRMSLDYSTVENAEFELLAANTVGTSTVVASASALHNENGFATNSHSAQDWDLWLRLANRGSVACSAATTMTYLIRPTSITQNHSARIHAMRAILERYELRVDPLAPEARRRASSRIREAEAERARALGDRWGAARAHVGAFFRWPRRRIAHAALSDLVAALLPADAIQ